MVRCMQLSQILSALIVLTGSAAASVAREAEILDFAARAADRDVFEPSYPSSVTHLDTARQPMFRATAQILTGPGSAAPAPQWTAPDGTPAPQIENMHAFGPKTAPRHRCAQLVYVRTWWNPPETERRRAMHFDTIGKIACEFGLPHRLLDALVAQESGFNPRAVSPAGATGMMQLMPGTARLLGVSNPFEPIANLRAGAGYLRQQLDRFGRVDLALAAYNAGPERRSLRLGIIPAIPETRHYVHTIITNWGRLITLDSRAAKLAAERRELAARAAQAAGYRSIEFSRYDGL